MESNKYLAKFGKDLILQAEPQLFNNLHHFGRASIHNKTDILNGKLISRQEINIMWQKQHREK